MKICFLAPTDSIHAQRWVQWFANNGHEVYLISWQDSGGINLHNVNVIKLQKVINIDSLNFIFMFAKIKGLLNKIKPDIIHAHVINTYGCIGALSRFHPLVATAWGSDVLVVAKKFLVHRLATQFALSCADAITCDAYHLLEAMVNLGGVKDKIRVIPFGIDVKKFAPGVNNGKLDKIFNVADDTLKVVSTRSLDPVYDVESLIRAIPVIIKEIPKTKFIIIGDGKQRPFLEELAKSLNISENIIFLGLVKNEELPKYLSSCDVYVSTSLSDGGLSASTAEAMACGLPAVVTDFGDNGRWVKNNEGGFLVPLKNPGKLAESIIVLLKNNELRKKFGAANRKMIEEKNNYDTEMKKAEALYCDLLKRREL